MSIDLAEGIVCEYLTGHSSDVVCEHSGEHWLPSDRSHPGGSQKLDFDNVIFTRIRYTDSQWSNFLDKVLLKASKI